MKPQKGLTVGGRVALGSNGGPTLENLALVGVCCFPKVNREIEKEKEIQDGEIDRGRTNKQPTKQTNKERNKGTKAQQRKQ